MKPPSINDTPTGPDSAKLSASAEFEGLDDLFAGVTTRIDRANRSPAWKLRMQPTILRRSVALISVLTLLVIAGAVMSSRPLSEFADPFNLIGLGGLGFLLLLSVWNATRPMHLPALSKGVSLILGFSCILGAFAFCSFFRPGH